MDIFLNKTYSFDEKVKDGAACVHECGNKFKLIQVTIDTAPFHNSRDVRFRFSCQHCGREVVLALLVDEDKVHPIFEPDEDRVAGIHFSFFANIPLNFDYANEKAESFSATLTKEIKRPINPNRIFRERKKNNGMVVEYIKRNGESLSGYSKALAKSLYSKTLAKSLEEAKQLNEKYARHAAQYLRPEDMSEELIDLTIPDELTIPMPKEGGWIRSKNEQEMVWREGKKINWETTKLEWAEQPIAQSKIGKGVVEPEKSAEKKINGNEPSDVEYDEFFDYDDYDNDTSTR